MIGSAVWRILFGFGLALTGGCVPAATPEHLAHTPGPAAIITETMFAGDGFRLRYPAGWRVVTGPAAFPQAATFIAPGDCTLIHVVRGETAVPPRSPTCAAEDLRTIQRTIVLPGVTIAIAGSAPAEAWEAFLAYFERLITTISN
ncbi:MAG: hypothetical protein SNJ59_08535 [Aggregatilineales bacterium]